MRPLLLLALAACTSTSSDIVGPFTGPVSRYVVDGITLPSNNATARALADDLDGDHVADNQLGQVCGTLSQQDDLTAHTTDMIASGAIAWSLELQAPDLTTAAKAAVTLYGGDGEPAVPAGGSIGAGTFTSNPTRTTRVPGMAILHLPVFADADPSIFELDAMEVELVPDGAGGYDVAVRGAVRPDVLAPAMCAGMQQMIYARPDDHYYLAATFDANRDGVITCDEITNNTLIRSLTAPDVTLDGQMMLSFGFGLHVKPCDSGACVTAPPADRCHDRVRDGDETGVDCGGSCAACPVANPSCGDGVRDGLETDVDCGWNCAGCVAGKHCSSAGDCAAGLTCVFPSVGFPGTCGPSGP